MRYLSCPLLSFVLALLVSCGVDSTGYVEHIENPLNGLSITKEIGGLRLNAQYKPLGYILLRERHLQPSQKQAWEHAEEELGELQYVNFSIQRVDGQSVLMTELPESDATIDLVTYFSFDLERDFYLLEGNDSLPCVLFHWPRQFDLAPKETFMLAFPKGGAPGDKTLLYNDRVLGIGAQRFTITRENIQSIPKLK